MNKKRSGTMPERFCSSGEQQQLCAACHVQLEERLLAVLTVTDLHRGLASIGMDLLQGVPLHRRSRKSVLPDRRGQTR